MFRRKPSRQGRKNTVPISAGSHCLWLIQHMAYSFGTFILSIVCTWQQQPSGGGVPCGIKVSNSICLLHETSGFHGSCFVLLAPFLVDSVMKKQVGNLSCEGCVPGHSVFSNLRFSHIGVGSLCRCIKSIRLVQLVQDLSSEVSSSEIWRIKAAQLHLSTS